MEVLNIIRARSVWLFSLDELNPHGKSVQTDELIDWLKDVYNFESSPDPGKKIDSGEGLVFVGGKFQVREEFSIRVNLTVYQDGVVAETISSTRDTDRFVENVLQSSVVQFGLSYKPSLIRRRLYVSELNLQCDVPFLNDLNVSLTEFNKKISGLVPEVKNVPFETASIGFWPNPEPSTPFALAPFRFERKLGSRFEEKRYYSAAPLHTDDHIDLLQELERHCLR